MQKTSQIDGLKVDAYSGVALGHLKNALDRNESVLTQIKSKLVSDVSQGKSLFVFGSGHSSILAFELYHRAGGPSFVVPVVADYLLPTAGPPVVRILERTPQVANVILRRAQPKKGEMIWIMSQSGINSAVVDLALDAKAQGMVCVAWTSVEHSRAVQSRHSSGKRLFEVCDFTVDMGGVRGDAAIQLSAKSESKAGPLSSLTAIFLAHSILVSACSELEESGHPCVYTSVNTPEGEAMNKKLEAEASIRDPLLR